MSGAGNRLTCNMVFFTKRYTKKLPQNLSLTTDSKISRHINIYMLHLKKFK